MHRSELHSIAVGRGGGSRYVDLHATLDGEDGDTTKLEFTNIDREEMQVLNSYIHNVLVKAMEKDAADDDSMAVLEDIEETDEVDDTDTSSRKRKSSRAASVVARKATKHQMESTAQKEATNDDDDNDNDDDEDEDEDDDFEATVKSDDEDDEDSEDDESDDGGSGTDGTESE